MSEQSVRITQMPLRSLSTEAGVKLHRVRDVTTREVKELLSSDAVRFVVAEIGKLLRWISEEERYRFWKSDVQVHVANEEKVRLDDSPDGYCYFASEWRSDASSEAVVLLEKHH